MIELYVFGIGVGVSEKGSHTLILKEIGGSRYLMVEIGKNEAQSIAIQLENAISPRPLTHDLITSLARAFDIEIFSVVISKLSNKIFYSEIRCRLNDRKISLDSRTSDAIAIALRVGCSIYVSEEVLHQAMEESMALKSKLLTEMTESELREKIEAAVQREDYKQAMVYKDELNKREGKI